MGGAIPPPPIHIHSMVLSKAHGRCLYLFSDYCATRPGRL